MDTTISKLILLYVFDRMEIPVTYDTLNDMCCSQNSWLSYMTLTQILPELIHARFIVSMPSSNSEYFKITQEGRDCLNFFYTKIPSSTRKNIDAYVKKNRQVFKRKQEYFRDYKKNKDGTYTLNLKIIDPFGSKLELELNVANRAEAITAFKRWNDSASDVYASIYQILIDGD